MKNLEIQTNPDVKGIFDNYPTHVRKKMLNLRRLVMETAEEMQLTKIEETLKWGEPSYLTFKGSTIRMDWKEKKPDQYALYFQCTSKLVPSFKIAYDGMFNYEGNRAIVFKMDEELPEHDLKRCIGAALTYHKVKKIPLLGL